MFFSYAEDDWEGRYNAVFPSTALIEFANGETRELPIRFSEYKSEKGMQAFAEMIDYDSFNDPVEMEIGFVTDSMKMTGAAAEAFEFRFKQTANVFIEVEGNEIVRYNLAGTAGNEEATYKIDPVAVLLQGADPMPSSVEVIYSNGTFGTVNVFSWDLPQITSALLTDQKANRTMTVTGQLTSDGMNPISVNVEFLKRYDMHIDQITFNPLSYRVVRDDQGYGYADHGDLLYDTVTVGFKDGTQVDVYKTDDNGNIVYDENGQPVVDHQEDNIVYYVVNGITWDTTTGSFGMATESTGSNTVTAIMADQYNDGKRITVSTDLVKQDVDFVMDDENNYQLQYFDVDYILVMLEYVSSTEDGKPQFGDVYTNLATPDSDGTLRGQRVSVYVKVEGEAEPRYIPVKADIKLGSNVPKNQSDINSESRSGNLVAYDLAKLEDGATMPTEGLTSYEATVTLYDGANTVIDGDIDMDIYFAYDSSATASADAQ